MAEFTYKSYCWNFGTTSFRTTNFNKTIERQLKLLTEFWELPGMDEVDWDDKLIQEKYYDYLYENDFLTGKADRKDKDAREKTSGLVDIGLINSERKLTEVGKLLLEISEKDDFNPEGLLHIPKDSYIYLKQLLKFGVGIDGKYVRPFVVILYALCELKYLTYDEFTYLLPLCTDLEKTNQIIDKIRQGRIDGFNIDDIIIDALLLRENYSSALKYFLNNNVSEEVICEIGMNRKSRNYDKEYYNLYILLKERFIENNKNRELDIIKCIDKINIGIFWKTLFFGSTAKRNILKDPNKYWQKTKFDSVNKEYEFKQTFFKYMHLFKAKATLHDYFDLNKRYIRTTNCITFKNDKVELDTIPGILINNAVNNIYNIIDKRSDDLYIDVKLDDICSGIEVSELEFLKIANEKFSKKFRTINEVFIADDAIRYNKFNNLIDEKFDNITLINLLECFENRNDKQIIEYLNSDADVPTIFEYILGLFGIL